MNHPNIAAIHGLEEFEDTHFLVLELIEGDTLTDRIKQGSISAEESLKLARQIAEALESAHEKGVIHRDLKLANIKITSDGKMKVIVIQSLESGDRRKLFTGRNAQYLSTGHIVYGLGNNLFAISFNPDKLEAFGTPISIIKANYHLLDFP